MEKKFNLEDFSYQLSNILKENDEMKGQIEDIKTIIEGIFQKAESYEKFSKMNLALNGIAWTLAKVFK